MIHYTGIIYIIGIILTIIGLKYVYEKNSITAWRIGLSIIVLAWLTYIISYIIQDYTLAPVFENSSHGSILYRIAASWSSSGGSLAAMVGLYAIVSLLTVKTRREAVFTTIIIIVIFLLSVVSGAYEYFPEGENLEAGAGLNPLLQDPLVLPHPLATFAAYSIIIAAGIATLAGRQPRFLIMLGWTTLSISILIGALWSYRSLGWGGYWAWDPVEVAELIPWLFLATSIHSMPLNGSTWKTAILGAAASIFLAIFVTRAGISPLHGFSEHTLAIGILCAAGFLLFASQAFHENSIGTLLNNAKQGFGSPKTWLALGSISLLYSASILMIILIITSLATIAGIASGVPTGDAGIRIYHTLLAPALLIMVISIPGSLYATKIPEKILKTSYIITILISLILITLTIKGTIVWSPKSTNLTNIYISALLPITGFSAGASLLRALEGIHKRNIRLHTISMTHFFLSLLILGVLISGPYSYSQNYYNTTTLTLNNKSYINNINIELKTYEYHIIDNKIDIYTKYAGKSPIYAASCIPLILVANGLDEIFMNALIGEKMITNEKLDKLIDPIYMDNLSINYNNIIINITNTHMYLTFTNKDNLSIINLNLIGNIIIDGLRREPAGEWFNISTTKIININNITINISGVMIYIPKTDLLFKNNTLYLNNTHVVLKATLIDTNTSLPYISNDKYIYSYSQFMATERSRELYNIIKNTNLHSWMMDPRNTDKLLEDMLQPGCEDVIDCLGYPPLPRTVPEGAELILVFEVDGEEYVAINKFMIGGEVSGIRGLVYYPMIVDSGLGDLYMEVYTPLVSMFDWSLSYPQIIIYYLNNIIDNNGVEESLAMASLLAAAYQANAIGGEEVFREAFTNPSGLFYDAIALYYYASIFDDSNTKMINYVIIKYKYVPFINLVWYSSVGLILYMLLSTFFLKYFSKKS